MTPILLRLLVSMLTWCPQNTKETVRIETLDLALMRQDWGLPQAGRSVLGNPLRLRGATYNSGIGTHAESDLLIELRTGAERFDAVVGVDDEVEKRGSVVFEVWADGRKAFDSGIMRGGGSPKQVSVSLQGVRRLRLFVRNADPNNESDHADWADATITLRSRTSDKPMAIRFEGEALPPIADPNDLELAIHGPSIVGTTAGHPFHYKIPATGPRPIRFSASPLPEGLDFDGAAGIFSGAVAHPGIHTVELTARADRPDGAAVSRILTIDARGKLALTPPMGWCSWNAFGASATDAKIRAAADALVSSGLADRGYRTIRIGDGWTGARGRNGALAGNANFPNLKALCAYVHSKGLRIGAYGSPGKKTCAGFEGSLGHEAADARTLAECGFDELEYDWCSHDGDPREAYAAMGGHLAEQPRDLLLAMSLGGAHEPWKWGRGIGHSWRTAGDLADDWHSILDAGFGQAGLERAAAPGGWNDPGPLMLGTMSLRGRPLPTRLEPNEQILHMSLWCISAAPLFLGCDLAALDELTKKILMNPEVLAVDQDARGEAARRIARRGSVELWARRLADGALAVAFFNRHPERATITIQSSELGLDGRHRARDLWERRDLDPVDSQLTVEIPSHGARLLKLTPAAGTVRAGR